MKKKLLTVLLGLMFFMGRTNDVIAENTDYAYGYGYTVYAGIYSNYFEGNVSGSYSAGSIITLTGWYYNSSHNYVYAGSASGSVYKYWSKPAVAVTWGKGYAKGIVADGGSATTSMVYQPRKKTPSIVLKLVWLIITAGILSIPFVSGYIGFSYAGHFYSSCIFSLALTGIMGVCVKCL